MGHTNLASVSWSWLPIPMATLFLSINGSRGIANLACPFSHLTPQPFCPSSLGDRQCLRFNSLTDSKIRPSRKKPKFVRIQQERLIKRRGIRPLPLFSKLTHLHGRTDVVNIALNSVDSLVEDMAGGRGLTVLLERSIYRLYERYRFEKSGGWEADFERVRVTVDGYRVAAGYACEERLDYLEPVPY